MNISRRESLLGAAAFAALPLLAAFTKPPAKGRRTYSVPVLGDIHFDSPDSSFYHSDYTHSTSRQRYEAHLAEHVRNAEMWKERLPRLIRASGTCLASDTTFSFRCGPDVFLVVDFNWPKPDLKLVKRLLKESEDARYTHLPIHVQQRLDISATVATGNIRQWRGRLWQRGSSRRIQAVRPQVHADERGRPLLAARFRQGCRSGVLRRQCHNTHAEVCVENE